MHKKKLTRFFLGIAGIALGVVIVSAVCYAIPQTINYQGYLTDSGGDPLNGTVDMVFRLYDVDTGGSPLWTETQTGVQVTDGLFSVNLGEVDPITNPLDLPFDTPYWLGVQVGLDAEMTPRQPVTSVGYAYRAEIADAVTEGGVDSSMLALDAVTADKIDDGAVLTAHLDTGAVTTDKLDDDAVTSAKILNNTVTADDIVDGPGSLLDADTLDSLNASDFMLSATDNWVDETGDSMSGKLTISVASGDGLESTTSKFSSSGVYGAGPSTGVKGLATDAGNVTYGVYGQSESSSGHGVFGYATASSGSTFGIYGRSDSTSGIAVYGRTFASSGETYGVYGVSASTTGRGVYGLGYTDTGVNYGVYGESASDEGYGVYGLASKSTGINYGVYGESESESGHGVYGYASASSGDTYGVYGESASTDGIGVRGWATAPIGTTFGVSGLTYSNSGRGVYGAAAGPIGTNYGVYGESESSSGYGIYGTAPKSGVHGEATASGVIITYGVYGRSESEYGYGVYGTAPNNGVYGEATAGTGTPSGVYGHSNSTSGRGVTGSATAFTGFTYGVRGESSSVYGVGVYGWAGHTTGINYGVYGQSDSPYGYDFYAGGQGNYYPFTGGHEAKLSADFPGEVEPGLIVAATGQAQKRHNTDGTVNLSSTLPTVKLADTSHDKAVFGVLVGEATLPEDHWYEAGEGERFASVNALGEGRVWVADINGAIEAGDYITTSAIPGYGQKQDDDLLHSYTLGKAIETVDWDSVTEMVKIDGKTFKVYLIAVVYTSG